MRVLVYAQDPGGSNVLARVLADVWPVLPSGVTVVAHPLAGPVFARQGVAAIPAADVLPPLPATGPQLADWLGDLRPQRVIATSSSRAPDLTNGLLVREARRAGVPTLTFLDHWVGMDRFLDDTGSPAYLPDVVGCIDRFCQERVLKLALVAAPIVGHPHLEGFSRIDRPPAARRTLRVLVVSQPVTTDGSMRGALLDPCDRAETCLDAIVAAVRGTEPDAVIAYRPHPKERPALDRLPVGAEQGAPGVELLERYDLFVGATSMLLFEAAIAGRHVVQLDVPELAGLVPAEYPPYRLGERVTQIDGLPGAVSRIALAWRRGLVGPGIPDLDLSRSVERASAVLRGFLGSE